ncbi:uncharacterized protein LOC135843948 [Planococcus citri]|uniref:uncharacterized protein LOC135843948 n=1 Tax=Planococcus citri TaxID=170843 RepID=UPI0031F8873B
MKILGVGLIGFVITSLHILCYIADAANTDTPAVIANLGSELRVIPIDIKEGDDTYITCNFKRSSTKTDKINWFHNDTQISTDFKAGIIASDEHLALQKVSKLSAGKYFCQVTTSNGTVNSNPVLVNVKDNPQLQNNAATSIHPSTENEPATKLENTSDTRFELPGFNKDFLNTLVAGQNETRKFETIEYVFDYTRNANGDVTFLWQKGKDSVEMQFRYSEGKIIQFWALPGASIFLTVTPQGDKEQTWSFEKYTYTYSNSAKNGFSSKWTGKVDVKAEYLELLGIYQDLISKWCDKNSFIVKEKKECVIY